MYTHKKTLVVVTPFAPQNAGQKTYTADKITEISVAVPDASTDLQVDIAIDVSQVKSFYINSTRAVLVETNDGTTPADSISLLANKPYSWDEDSYDTFLLGTDVTALFLTNASGSAATVTVSVLEDPTD